MSFSIVNWIDLFVRKEYKHILVDCLNYCIDNKRLELYTWRIMTSHVHLIIGSSGNPMENIMRDLKRHTSEELHKIIRKHPQESRKQWLLEMMEKAGKENSNNRGFQLWQQDNHPVVLDTAQIAHQKMDYLTIILLRQVL